MEQHARTWDAVVIGGGAAGLSAALMLGRSRRSVLVIDAGSPRNRFAHHMHGVLGRDATPPRELLELGREELRRYGVEFASVQVESVTDGDSRVRVLTADGLAHDARAVVVATGVADDLPEIPGLAGCWGVSVLHCPYCHGYEVADRRLAVLATSPFAPHQAQLLRQLSDRVTLFTDLPLEDEARAGLAARGIALVESTVVEVVAEEDQVRSLRTADGQVHAADAIFTAATLRPLDGFLDGLGLERNETPFASVVAVDQMGRTSHPRIWAAGNVVNPMASVPIAMGAGNLAGAAANGALVEEDVAAARG